MKLSVILAFAWLTAAQGATPAPDADSLRGNWLGVAGKIDGSSTALNADLTLTGDTFSLRLGRTLYEGNVVRGRKGKMQTVDLEVTACFPLCRPTASVLDERGAVRDFRETWRGIYALDDGTLKLCFGKRDRPKEFAAEAGSGHSLFRFEKPRRRGAALASPR